MNHNRKRIVFSLFSVLFWIGIWEIGALLANRNLLFPIPTPMDTVMQLIQDGKTATFWVAVANSLKHILIGFSFGVILGLLFGIFSGNSTLFKTLTAPISRLVRSVPVAAIVILAWLWIPSDGIPTLIAFLMVFPILWIQVENGLYSVDGKLVEMGKIMGMKPLGILRHIKLPVVLPAFRNGVMTALGFAWKSGVAAEVICNPSDSIGATLSAAKNNLDYTRVFSTVLMIILLSLFLENIIKLIWKEKRNDNP